LSPGEAVHTTRTVNKGDLVIAISFRRGLRQTVEGLQQARNNGAYCVGITDTYVSPIARFSDECFLASIDSPSFGGSYAAPMTLMNILIVACAHYRRDRTLGLVEESGKGTACGGSVGLWGRMILLSRLSREKPLAKMRIGISRTTPN